MAFCESEADFKKQLVSKKASDLYLLPCVNYVGQAKDSQRDYADIAAEMIIKGELEFSPAELSGMEFLLSCPVRAKGESIPLYSSGRFISLGERIAARMFETELEAQIYGENCVVSDYSVPVGNSGKFIDLVFTSTGYKLPDFLRLDDIDLESKNDPVWRYMSRIRHNLKKEPRSLVISSLKTSDSEDGLLKSVIEIETFYRKISHDVFKKRYSKKNIEKAVVLFEDSRAAREYFSSDFKHVRGLMSSWKIAVLFAKEFYVDVEPRFNEYHISSVTHIFKDYYAQLDSI